MWIAQFVGITPLITIAFIFVAGHQYDLDIRFPDHPPEIIKSVRSRSLRGNVFMFSFDTLYKN